jgi:hypothetical protein
MLLVLGYEYHLIICVSLEMVRRAFGSWIRASSWQTGLEDNGNL